MLRDEDLDREILSDFSTLSDEKKAELIEILSKSLSEQVKVSSGRQSKSGANP
jgi:hypothetical protein